MVYGDRRYPGGSCQPLLLARCRLQHLAGSHVTRCQFMCHLLPARVSPAAGSITRCRAGLPPLTLQARLLQAKEAFQGFYFHTANAIM